MKKDENTNIYKDIKTKRGIEITLNIEDVKRWFEAEGLWATIEEAKREVEKAIKIIGGL